MYQKMKHLFIHDKKLKEYKKIDLRPPCMKDEPCRRSPYCRPGCHCVS